MSWPVWNIWGRVGVQQDKLIMCRQKIFYVSYIKPECAYIVWQPQILWKKIHIYMKPGGIIKVKGLAWRNSHCNAISLSPPLSRRPNLLYLPLKLIHQNSWEHYCCKEGEKGQTRAAAQMCYCFNKLSSIHKVIKYYLFQIKMQLQHAVWDINEYVQIFISKMLLAWHSDMKLQWVSWIWTLDVLYKT